MGGESSRGENPGGPEERSSESSRLSKGVGLGKEIQETTGVRKIEKEINTHIETKRENTWGRKGDSKRTFHATFGKGGGDRVSLGPHSRDDGKKVEVAGWGSKKKTRLFVGVHGGSSSAEGKKGTQHWAGQLCQKGCQQKEEITSEKKRRRGKKERFWEREKSKQERMGPAKGVQKLLQGRGKGLIKFKLGGEGEARESRTPK